MIATHVAGPYRVELAANRVVTLAHGVPQFDRLHQSQAEAVRAFNDAADLVTRCAAERPGTLAADERLRLREWQDGCADIWPGEDELSAGYRPSYLGRWRMEATVRDAEREAAPVFRQAAE